MTVFYYYSILIIGIPTMILLFRHSEELRNSQFWVIGVIAWLCCSIFVPQSILAILLYYDIPLPSDDIVVPIYFGIIIVVVVIFGIINLYLPMRRNRLYQKELDERYERQLEHRKQQLQRLTEDMNSHEVGTKQINIYKDEG